MPSQDMSCVHTRVPLFSVLQCVAVCCSVLQYVAVCCSVSQCVAVCCSVSQCVAVCCSDNVSCVHTHHVYGPCVSHTSRPTHIIYIFVDHECDMSRVTHMMCVCMCGYVTHVHIHMTYIHVNHICDMM